MRQDDDDGSGGTLSRNKQDVYILLKIFKILYGLEITSFLLKFAIDRGLEDKKFENIDLGKSLERVIKYHQIRGKFDIKPYPNLQKRIGFRKFELDFINGKLKLISPLKVCKNGDYEDFKYLLSLGADPNEENYLHATVENYQRDGGCFEIIKTLVEKKADVNRKTEQISR